MYNLTHRPILMLEGHVYIEKKGDMSVVIQPTDTHSIGTMLYELQGLENEFVKVPEKHAVRVYNDVYRDVIKCDSSGGVYLSLNVKRDVINGEMTELFEELCRKDKWKCKVHVSMHNIDMIKDANPTHRAFWRVHKIKPKRDLEKSKRQTMEKYMRTIEEIKSNIDEMKSNQLPDDVQNKSIKEIEKYIRDRESVFESFEKELGTTMDRLGTTSSFTELKQISIEMDGLLNTCASYMM